MCNTVESGRESFQQHAWEEAYNRLSAADHKTPLNIADLETLAVSAYLIGADQDSDNAWERAHQECMRTEDLVRAARCAFWLALNLLLRGEMSRGGGWLSRSRRLLEDHPDCVEQGYLLVPVALGCMSEGDFSTASDVFSQAADIGERFNDPDLVTLGRLGQGQAFIHQGRVPDGLALLDEAMVAVTAGELSPMIAGIIYCSMIEACQETFDLRRAQEWTTALSNWCDTQPELVLYRGQCLVHRSEILLLHGDWPDSMDEADLALKRLSQPSNQPAAGMAFYQQGELHRLRGEFAKAEEAYRNASQHGREPMPGLALLRLSQGQSNSAAATIRRLVDDAQGWVAQAKLYPAYIEIMLETGEVEAARVVADQLLGLAEEFDAPFLRALSAHSAGAVLLYEGEFAIALTELRHAWTAWKDLQVPYEAARVRILIGLVCRRLGDEDTAAMEFDAARTVLQQLGAAPELARVEALSRLTATQPSGGLTKREVEVLRLVAVGKTNMAIADDLVISQKTVARHMSNIFTKLGLSSRSAVTAYAYQNDLL
ncbi:MAG: helix-turn-helix transcriptional regulator [SAR202 cluster bacterium Casp-Chloro-G4]|nr:LuxR C-terminal-related transcriptional regulator [Chloroflexota bacterium]PKB61080.1 MAG: helix-turn-helix transcriptional regulator [SAR202 cluster bacterium Casp-Chloro-G4]